MKRCRRQRIVLEEKFVALDPGSRAKRYWAGFGAGKSSVKVVGTLKDSREKSSRPLSNGESGRSDSVAGDSLGKMMSDARSIGDDLATFLAKWGRREKLD